MTRDYAALARTFLDSVSAPCLTEEAVALGLTAVFASDAAHAVRPFVSDLRTRRTENVAAPVFARAARELHVTREELASDSNARWLSPKRDAVVYWLCEAGLSRRAVGALVNRDRRSVRDGLRRHEARLGAAVVVGRVPLRAVAR